MNTIWTEEDSLNLTVTLVARDGHRMPLEGDERRAAIERMIADGHSRQEIADRLCMTPKALSNWASRADVTLPDPESRQWWVGIAHPSSRAEYRRRHDQGYKTGRVAA